MSNYVMLINNKNNYYEYTTDSVAEALDRYIEDCLGFDSGFSVSQCFWNKIKTSVSDDDSLVRLANGLIKRNFNKIKKVVNNYSSCFPITIEFTSVDGYSIFNNSNKVDNLITVHSADTLKFNFIADEWYKLPESKENINIYDKYTGARLTDYTYTVVPPSLELHNITAPVNICIETTKEEECPLWFIIEICEDVFEAGTRKILYQKATQTNLVNFPKIDIYGGEVKFSAYKNNTKLELDKDYSFVNSDVEGRHTISFNNVDQHIYVKLEPCGGSGAYDKVIYIKSADGTYAIVDSYNGTAPQEVILDTEYEGVPVTTIGYKAFENQDSMLIIDIPNGITDIGAYAFALSGVEHVSLPPSVTRIGEGAFKHSNLSMISIPNSVTNIGEGAFEGCINLSDIFYAGTVEDWNRIYTDSNNDLETVTINYETYSYS